MFSCHLQLCQVENQNELAKSCTSSILEGKKKSSFEENEINPQFKLNFDYSVKLQYTVPITISTCGLNVQANNVSFKRNWTRITDRESSNAILSLVKVKSCHYWRSHEHLNPHFRFFLFSFFSFFIFSLCVFLQYEICLL